MELYHIHLLSDSQKVKAVVDENGFILYLEDAALAENYLGMNIDTLAKEIHAQEMKAFPYNKPWQTDDLPNLMVGSRLGATLASFHKIAAMGLCSRKAGFRRVSGY